MGFLYDFGDKWFIDIKVENIAPVEESKGSIFVIDGSGGVLPDGDDFGTWSWKRHLQEADKSPLSKRKAVELLFKVTSFTDKRPPQNPLDYDFDAFDLEATRKSIREALDSKTSLPLIWMRVDFRRRARIRLGRIIRGIRLVRIVVRRMILELVRGVGRGIIAGRSANGYIGKKGTSLFAVQWQNNLAAILR
ncbi:hypothetical protein NP233_g3158 [Leucocoprinus birnbaumii]|uniref:Uncharacterized protein n=1 Tax=Leucocoprinus birnbaumii TaxID=56174 RepID=A0AAD5W0U3_9AGAR|nr:hypothetical protein NP233_g3158 [Leucocoprinus birnbaumii]